MPQYLVAIHHPDGYDGSKEGAAMERDIDVLNQEMQAKGCQVFRWWTVPGSQREVTAGAA